MTLKVIDVSDNQTVSTLTSAIASGAQAVIIKATQGTSYTNELLDEQYTAAINAGVKYIGFYHYMTGVDPVAQANYFLSVVDPYLKKTSATLWCDWESGENSSFGNGSAPKSFVDTVRSASKSCGIYTGLDGIAQTGNLISSYVPLWFAAYPTGAASWTVPNFNYSILPWSSLTMWQFTDSNGALDRSEFYGDGATWEALSSELNSTTVINSNNTTTTVSNATELEDDDLMKFTYEIINGTTKKSQGTVYFYDGTKVIALTDVDQLNIINQVYKDTTGKSLKHYKWLTTAPWYIRFLQAINQKTPETAWK